jgi:hypothetical protein
MFNLASLKNHSATARIRNQYETTYQKHGKPAMQNAGAGRIDKIEPAICGG